MNQTIKRTLSQKTVKSYSVIKPVAQVLNSYKNKSNEKSALDIGFLSFQIEQNEWFP